MWAKRDQTFVFWHYATFEKNSKLWVVTLRSRTGLRMQESWFWAWTRVHRKTHEEVFWLLTRTLTKFK